MQLLNKRIIFNGVEYLVYSDRRIFGPTGVEISQRPNHDGYATVTLGSKKKGRKRVFVHRIVAELFLENPNNYSDVDYLDSNRMNPSADNIEMQKLYIVIKYIMVIRQLWQKEQMTLACLRNYVGNINVIYPCNCRAII